MRKVYTFADLENWDEVTASELVPIRLAVIGDPVAHSASPPMHNAALAASHIDAKSSLPHFPSSRKEISSV